MKRYQIIALSIICLLVLYYFHIKTNKLQSDILAMAEKYENIVRDNIMHNDNLDKVIRMIENSVESTIYRGNGNDDGNDGREPSILNETFKPQITMATVDTGTVGTSTVDTGTVDTGTVDTGTVDTAGAVGLEGQRTTDNQCTVEDDSVNICKIGQCGNLSTIDELSTIGTLENCSDNGPPCVEKRRDSLRTIDVSRLSDIDTDSDAFESDDDDDDDDDDAAVLVDVVDVDDGDDDGGDDEVDDANDACKNITTTTSLRNYATKNIISSYSNDSVDDTYAEEEIDTGVQFDDSALNANIMNSNVMNTPEQPSDSDSVVIKKANLIDELQQKLPFIDNSQYKNDTPLPNTATSSDMVDGSFQMSISIDSIPTMTNSDISKLKLQYIKQLASDLQISTTFDGYKKKTKKELVGEILSYKKNIL